ncbi:MAG: PIN domain-containing protein [Candidatus Bathyarchaeia archaeon]
MNRAVFDTRFFMAGYYSTNEVQSKKLIEKARSTKERFVSAIVLHEVYQVTLRKNGRETAKLRTALVEQDFEVIDVTAEIAKSSAELRSKYNMSMADSIIAATAYSLKATCLSDDPHFKAVKEIKTDWI